MKRALTYSIFTLLVLSSLLFNTSCGESFTHVEIETEYGKMKMMLYNSTPGHKANFIKLVNEGFYEDLLFHRLVPGFMAQGGDPNSKGAAPGTRLGGGGTGYTLPAEIGAPHIKGAVAAARLGDGVNPEKESSGCQFFIVHGGPQNANALEQIQNRKGIQYNEVQKQLYMTKGGYPSLDLDYTVFGEIIEGLDVLDQFIMEKRDPNNRPDKDVWMKIKIVN